MLARAVNRRISVPSLFVSFVSVVDTMKVDSPQWVIEQFSETVCRLPLWTVPRTTLNGEPMTC